VSVLLAITTSTRCSGCALWSDDGPIGSVASVAAHRHAEFLMPAVDQLCRTAGVGPGDLSAVVVDVGPGLFTGLRVGISAANSIALARGLPVVGITSLEALAYPHRRTPGVVAAVVDARRAEVYWATFGRSTHGQPALSQGAWGQLSAPVVTAPEVLADHLAAIDGPVLAVGDGAHRYRSIFEAHGEVGSAASGTELWPSPLALAELGDRQLRALGLHAGDSPAAAQPVSLAEALYLRQADVRIGWDQLDGRVGPAASPEA
jgi:tRNA threonylcarbamoyladenosine biosynthesis protein TsaB